MLSRRSPGGVAVVEAEGELMLKIVGVVVFELVAVLVAVGNGVIEAVADVVGILVQVGLGLDLAS